MRALPMLALVERHHGDATPVASVTLAFDSRQRSRLRVRLDDGREAALMLPRGEVLRGGDRVASRCGAVIEVRAASETLSEVSAKETEALARAAYHLGNRHVAVEVGPGWLRYRHDHVLDDMLRGLGLSVGTVSAAFEPEAGAYAGSHGHAPSHSHAHDDEYDHDHEQHAGDDR